MRRSPRGPLLRHRSAVNRRRGEDMLRCRWTVHAVVVVVAAVVLAGAPPAGAGVSPVLTFRAPYESASTVRAGGVCAPPTMCTVSESADAASGDVAYYNRIDRVAPREFPRDHVSSQAYVHARYTVTKLKPLRAVISYDIAEATSSRTSVWSYIENWTYAAADRTGSDDCHPCPHMGYSARRLADLTSPSAPLQASYPPGSLTMSFDFLPDYAGQVIRIQAGVASSTSIGDHGTVENVSRATVTSIRIEPVED